MQLGLGQWLLNVHPPQCPSTVWPEGFCGWALGWCAHKVHTVQTILYTPSPTPELPTFPGSCLALPSTPLLLLCWAELLVGRRHLKEFWRRFPLPRRSPFTATTMVRSGIFRVFLLVLLGLLVTFVHTGKHSVGSDIFFYSTSVVRNCFFMQVWWQRIIPSVSERSHQPLVIGKNSSF